MSTEPRRRTIDDLPILTKALARAINNPPSKAHRRCRRWHRRWHSDIFIVGDRPAMDCTRCELRYFW